MALVDLGSLVLPEACLQLALDLENRGLRLAEVKGSLRVHRDDGESPQLTEEDRAAITRWKLHLLALVEYIRNHEDRVPEQDISKTSHALKRPVGKRKSKQ